MKFGASTLAIAIIIAAALVAACGDQPAPRPPRPPRITVVEPPTATPALERTATTERPLSPMLRRRTPAPEPARPTPTTAPTRIQRVQTRTPPQPILIEQGGYFPALLGPVTAGESFDIKIVIVNGGGDGERGGISVSFPTLTGGSESSSGWTSSLADVRVVDYTSGTRNVSIYKTGDSLNHANGSRMSAEHLLIESDDAMWRSDTGRELTLRVTPKRAGDFPIMYRAWICADGYSNCERHGNGTGDQQGYAAHRGVVEVAAPPAADDHGDDRSSATRVSVGSSASGVIGTAGDEDFFSFRAQSGTQYAIETRVRADLDTVIELHSGQGGMLAQDDDDGSGRGSRIVWTAPSSGTYYVNVYGYDGSVGGYDLSMSRVVVKEVVIEKEVLREAPMPAPTQPTAKTISAGSGHTCALRADGSAVCWGHNDYGQASPPSGVAFVAISASSAHTCGLRADGTAICWGADDHDFGQASPPSGETFAAISAGPWHTCGLRADGAAVCWGAEGDADYGQASPPSGVTFAAISAGRYHTCGLRADGAAVCWGAEGDADYGQASPPGGETFAAISAVSFHTCALRADGAAICWGADDHDFGQASPPSGETFAAISAGLFHTCGLRADGAAVCWGSDTSGQSSPPGGETFAAISAGSSHTCVLREDGSAVCWGWNDDGQSSPPSGVTFALP